MFVVCHFKFEGEKNKEQSTQLLTLFGKALANEFSS